jgi:protein-disulfide isomerase
MYRMQMAERGRARRRFILLCIIAAVFLGSGAALLRVYEPDEPLSLTSTDADKPQFSPAANNNVEPAAIASLTAVLARRRSDLERDPNAPVLGNPDGDVTVVEFFDYNCPFCKKVARDMKRLITEDSGVRLVYREWPIINRGSQFAARAALAARRQGKYEELHWALMAQPRVTETSTLQAARALGLDMARLQSDMNHRSVARHISLSMDLTRTLAINGTPAFVIGEVIKRGVMPFDELRQYVRDARAAKEVSVD